MVEVESDNLAKLNYKYLLYIQSYKGVLFVENKKVLKLLHYRVGYH